MSSEFRLYCPRCKKHLDVITWRYTEPVDDFAPWHNKLQRYEYDCSVGKGDLGCITLCYYCGAVLKNFGYMVDYETGVKGS